MPIVKPFCESPARKRKTLTCSLFQNGDSLPQQIITPAETGRKKEEGLREQFSPQIICVRTAEFSMKAGGYLFFSAGRPFPFLIA